MLILCIEYVRGTRVVMTRLLNGHAMLYFARYAVLIDILHGAVKCTLHCSTTMQQPSYQASSYRISMAVDFSVIPPCTARSASVDVLAIDPVYTCCRWALVLTPATEILWTGTIRTIRCDRSSLTADCRPWWREATATSNKARIATVRASRPRTPDSLRLRLPFR